MQKESEDKAERVLSIYARLKQGKVISKEQESQHYHVATRTIQRDIADIQCFLQNQELEAAGAQEIAFDKVRGGYVLRTKNRIGLEPKEALAASKILLESRALVKDELFPIIHKLTECCAQEEDTKLVEDLLRNEMHHYVELYHGKRLLDLLWELEQAVKGQKYIEIRYKKLKNHETVTRKVKPVGVMFSEFYFYLTAFIDGIDKEKAFQNPDDQWPTIYRVDRLEDVVVLDEHFAVPYAERFEEGEFRKRVQFMYGGKLRKVKLKCAEQSLEAVLDRLPTAEVIEKTEEGYVVQTEVFGDGIERWLKGQEGLVEAIQQIVI